MKKTRFKITTVVVFVMVACAILKHFLPGLSIEILGLAMINGLGYLWSETKRKSD